MSNAPHFGVLAGEKSGDILAGSVLRELKRRNEALRVTGIAAKRQRSTGWIASLIWIGSLSLGLLNHSSDYRNSYRFEVL